MDMTPRRARAAAWLLAPAALLLTLAAFATEPAGATSGDVMPVSDLPMNRAIDKAHAAGSLDGLHAVLVIHDGEVLAERYYAGDDERWGTPLGRRSHGPDTLHDIRSVTKSIVGLLYGIALDAGKVPSPEASLLAQFPEYVDLGGDPRRAAMRISHALSMTLGTEWNEELPYTDPRNSEIAMENAKDRYRFALDRPLLHAPGEQWTYNGGAVALVGRLIERGVGQPINAYARDVLFGPLGIEDVEWVQGADGVPSAASGLRLSARSLAAIGRLILDDGRVGDRQIVSADWLAASFRPQAELDGLRYGYLWWLAPWGDPPAWVAGFGNGGQRLTVQPAIDLVVVVQAGNYNDPTAWQVPVRIIEEFVAPVVRERLGR